MRGGSSCAGVSGGFFIFGWLGGGVRGLLVVGAEGDVVHVE